MFDSKEYLKQYYKENREKIIANVKKNKHKYSENKETRRIRSKRYMTDPLKRIIHKNRMCIKMSLKRGGYKRNSCPYNLLGCEYDFYLKYLESKFEKDMNWNNYGTWHIDHTKPLSLGKSESEIKTLFNYKNTQPLWALDNLKKGVN